MGFFDWLDDKPKRKTRSYEYVVYPSTRVSGSGIEVDGFGEKGFQAAKKVAKNLGRGSGIYNVSKGRFVGYIGPSGKCVPIGYPR